MHAAGRAWIGKLVLRYWEDQGGWWEALVGDYSVKNGKHKLIYDASTEDVSYLPPWQPCMPWAMHISFLGLLFSATGGLKCLESSLDRVRQRQKAGNVHASKAGCSPLWRGHRSH